MVVPRQKKVVNPMPKPKEIVKDESWKHIERQSQENLTQESVSDYADDEEECERLFKLFDVQGTGTIGHNEIKKIMKQYGEDRPADVSNPGITKAGYTNSDCQ